MLIGPKLYYAVKDFARCTTINDLHCDEMEDKLVISATDDSRHELQKLLTKYHCVDHTNPDSNNKQYRCGLDPDSFVTFKLIVNE